MANERDLTYTSESSRQGFVFGTLLVGYGSFRTVMALPDPLLLANLEQALMLWIQTAVGIVGLLAGVWLLHFHQSQKRAVVTTLEASRQIAQSIHALLEDLQGFGRALVDIGPTLARDIEEAQREHLDDLLRDTRSLARARVRNGAFVAESMERVAWLLDRARSAAIDHRGEEMITLGVQAEKHLRAAAEALPG